MGRIIGRDIVGCIDVSFVKREEARLVEKRGASFVCILMGKLYLSFIVA